MANKWLSNLIGTKLTEFWIRRAKFDSAGLSANRTFTLPDLAGTIALRPDTVTLTDASTVTISAANGIDFYVAMTASRTIGSPGAGYNGQKILIAVENASGGNITPVLTVGSSNAFRFLGTASGLSVIADNATAYLIARYHSGDSRWDVLGWTGDFTQNPVEFSKSVAVESPTSSEDISLFFTPDAITVSKMVAVLVGSSSPSVTWTIRHSTDRSATGNEVVTSGTTTTSVTSGSVVTSFNDATIPANSFVWLETTAQSGTVSSINISLIYTKD